MPISFACRACGKRLKAPESAAGKTSKCPQCGKPVTCPKPAAESFDEPEILDDVDPYGDIDAGPLPQATATAAPSGSKQPCPQCGEIIAVGADECRYCGTVFTPPVKKAAKKKSKGKSFSGYASVWARFVALFADNLIIGLPSQLILPMIIHMPVVTPPAPGHPPTLPPDYFEKLGMLWCISMAINVAYFAGMESSSRQATLGKMMMGLKVTDLSGQRISFLRAVGRYFGKVLSGAICAIGFIMAFFTEKTQALHDKLAGTLVVK